QQIVHRDVKPENVMLRADGSAVVLDFGLAHRETPDQGRASGTLAGTPRYMAPEQLEGADVTMRSDVFACGLLAYELYTGKPAFGGGARAQGAGAIRRAPPRPLVAPGLDERRRAALERILRRALAKEPEARHASARALLDDLGAALTGGRRRGRLALAA